MALLDDFKTDNDVCVSTYRILIILCQVEQVNFLWRSDLNELLAVVTVALHTLHIL